MTDLADIGRSLVYGVVLNESQGGFRFANASLPDAGKAQLEQLMLDVSANPKAVVFEIEGHTDSSGATALNKQIGLDRAETVKSYLHEQHKVPLHKMNVISYGESRPVDSNARAAAARRTAASRSTFSRPTLPPRWPRPALAGIESCRGRMRAGALSPARPDSRRPVSPRDWNQLSGPGSWTAWR